MDLNFGTTFKRIRMDKNMSQQEVANNVMTRSYYSKIEANDNIPTVDKFYGLLTNLNISPEEFLYVHNHFAPTEKEKLFQTIRQGLQSEKSQRIWTAASIEAQNFFEQTGDIIYRYLHIIADYLLSKYHGAPKKMEELQEIKNYLFDLDHFYLNDIFFFNILISEYQPRTVELMVDRLLKNAYEYAQFPNYGTDILIVLMNLAYFFYSNNQVDNGDFFLTLLQNRKKNASLMYERNAITFLEGLSLILNNQLPQGKMICENSILILEELHLNHAKADYQMRLTTILSLATENTSKTL